MAFFSRHNMMLLRRGFNVMDDVLGPIDNSGETQMMISTLSQIKMVSAQDFALAMASLDEVFDAVQEPLQLLRSRSLAIYRKRVREKKFDVNKIEYSRALMQLYFNFFTATSWDNVKRAFDAITRGDERVMSPNKDVGLRPPIPDQNETKDLVMRMEIFDFFEKLVLDTINEANDHKDVILASKGMRNKIQQKKVLQLMRDATDVFADAAFPKAKSVVDFISEAGEQMLLMDAPSKQQDQADVPNTHASVQNGTTPDSAPPGPGAKRPLGARKPMTAFMFFNMETRPKVVEKNPGAGFGEVGKKLGDMWKSLSEEEKKPYAEKALQDKKRYETEVAEDEDEDDDEDEDEDDE